MGGHKMKTQKDGMDPVEPKSTDLKRARWTQLEKDVQRLKVTRKPTKEILNALRPQYPDLTWEIVRSICNKRSKRRRKR